MRHPVDVMPESSDPASASPPVAEQPSHGQIITEIGKVSTTVALLGEAITSINLNLTELKTGLKFKDAESERMERLTSNHDTAIRKIEERLNKIESQNAQVGGWTKNFLWPIVLLMLPAIAGGLAAGYRLIETQTRQQVILEQLATEKEKGQIN